MVLTGSMESRAKKARREIAVQREKWDYLDLATSLTGSTASGSVSQVRMSVLSRYESIILYYGIG